MRSDAITLQRAKALWPVAIVAAVVAFGVAFGRLTLDDAKRICTAASDLAKSDPVLVFFAMLVANAVGMALSLPVKAILSVIAGALLGVTGGAASTISGVLLGASALFFVARFLFRQRFVARLGPRAKALEHRLSGHPIRALAGLRLTPTLPYALITLAAALTSVKFRHFLIGSFIGDLPIVVLYAMAGERLSTMSSISEALSPYTLAVLIAIGLALTASAFLKKRRTE